MSYCRFAQKVNQWDLPPSDLYVYLDIGGYLLCCGCKLTKGGFAAKTTAEMILHIEQHKLAGHIVRDNVIPMLVADQEENDAWMMDGRSRQRGMMANGTMRAEPTADRLLPASDSEHQRMASRMCE